MSKIEEMAEKAFPTKSWEEERSAYLCRKIYCMGANAVLEEILRYIGNHSSFEFDILKDKLKELKGEEVVIKFN